MTAELVLSTVRDDDGETAVWLPAEGAPVLYLTPARARELTDQTRAMLGQAGANLVALREGSAHIALGYEHWHEYVETEFGDLFVYRLVKDRAQRVAERQALVASLTIAGHTVREQRDALGASLGTVHGDQRALGLVPDRPLPTLVDDEAEQLDPFRGLSRTHEALARVAAQEAHGMTSHELDLETGWPMGTATGLLSRLERGRGGRGGGLLAFGDGPLRERRLPYVVTDRGRALLAEVLAARDTAEATQE